MPGIVVINVAADVLKTWCNSFSLEGGPLVCLRMSTWFVNHDKRNSEKLGKVSVLYTINDSPCLLAVSYSLRISENEQGEN